jgi:hypothetical protein
LRFKSAFSKQKQNPVVYDARCEKNAPRVQQLRFSAPRAAPPVLSTLRSLAQPRRPLQADGTWPLGTVSLHHNSLQEA